MEQRLQCSHKAPHRPILWKIRQAPEGGWWTCISLALFLSQVAIAGFTWRQAEPLPAWSCRWCRGRRGKMPSDVRVRFDLSGARHLPDILEFTSPVFTLWHGRCDHSSFGFLWKLPALCGSITAPQRVTEKGVVPLAGKLSPLQVPQHKTRWCQWEQFQGLRTAHESSL